MTILYATHNQNQGQGSAEATQGSRYQHVWGQICRPTADAPGKSGIFRRTTGGKKRDSEKNDIFMGVRNTVSVYRSTAASSGRTRSYSAYSYAPEIIFGEILTKCTIVHTPLLQNVQSCIIIVPVINFVGDSTSPFAVPCARKLITKQAHRERHFYVQT